MLCIEHAPRWALDKDYNFISGGSKIYGSPPTVLIGVNCVPARIVSEKYVKC